MLNSGRASGPKGWLNVFCAAVGMLGALAAGPATAIAGDACCSSAGGLARADLPRHRIFEASNLPLVGAGGEPIAMVGLDQRVLAQALAAARGTQGSGRFVVEGFPLSGSKRITLELEPFAITGPEFRAVMGRPLGAGGDGRLAGRAGDGAAGEVPLAYDPASLVLLRGRAIEHAHSRVFVAVTPALGVMGWIDLGPGEGRHVVTSRARSGAGSGPVASAQFGWDGEGRVLAAVFRERIGPDDHDPLLGVPLCGTECRPTTPPEPSVTDSEIRRGLKRIRLAVETDVDYYRLFNDQQAAMDYVLVMYAACSEIFIREINVKLEVVYVRLWDQPSGLNYHTHSDPLPRFASNWNTTQQGITRAVAQYFSGRRDLAWGGIAYLNGLCNNSSYSVVGYAQGEFASIETPNVFSFDVLVASHELGHNFNARHTHDYGIDMCQLANTPARRGTVMSYCSQTVSGGKASQDFRFETQIQRVMRQYIVGRACIDFDCNNNGIDDATDILTGFSQDANANGIPDECEDCNQNGVLDSIDIATMFSLDLNNNGIPDECEPDCNNNGIPDDLDIFLGTSQDLHQNGIPDECEADCNSNGVSDYNEIMLNMALDVDRDTVLDSCQRCDGGSGVPDLAALNGAHNAWIASTSAGGPVREVHALTGVVYREAPQNRVDGGQDLIISPQLTVLVTSAGGNKVVEFDRTGAYVRDFVSAGSGGLSYPTGLVSRPGGNLFVASHDTHSVLEYDGQSGAFVRTFVVPGSGGLTQPFGLIWSAEGNLLVTSADNRVLEYDGQSGAFVRILVSAGSGGLSSPRGMAFKRDGRLLVASHNTNALLEYDQHTGAFIRQFNRGGTATILSLDGPWGVRLGRDGHIYASRHLVPRSHVTTTRIFIYHGESGILLRAYVVGNDTDIYAPTGFDFMPGDGYDCNGNLVPDACDITSGFSRDRNSNGIPDECEGPTCYANCDLSTVAPVLNVDDFTCFINEFALASALPPGQQVNHYANCDGSTVAPVLNVDDFTCFINAFALGCP
jgi:DNA-binding beta-propeller fold protein YncE